MTTIGLRIRPMTELDQLERLADYSTLIGGYGLISMSAIRQRQDERMTERVCRRALRLIPDEELITLNGDGFFVGSVDFIVRENTDGSLHYVVLETNGGSSRGYTAVAMHQIEQFCNGYLEMLRFIDDPTPVIVMGHPKQDSLIVF